MGKALFFQGEKYFGYGFADHIFSPQRHYRVLEEIKRRNLLEHETLVKVKTKAASEEILKLFHAEEYIRRVKDLSAKGEGYLDYGDTPATMSIYEKACNVVWAAVEGIKEVWRGKIKKSFNMVGGLHHAFPERAAGFCVFNDVAIAIKHGLENLRIEKILYIDIDAHHGDGVFYGFYTNPKVWIADVHQIGLFPGTGFRDETGEEKAKGTKINFPLIAGSGDEELLRCVQEIIKFGKRCEPEIILLQGGVDGFKEDPLTHLNYTLKGYLEAVKKISELAEGVCEGKLMFFGGGGYNYQNCAKAWSSVLELFLGSWSKINY
jgi:acetoin utilization protein AcuC